MSRILETVSKDAVCEEIEKKDGIYLVCKDREGKVIYEHKLMTMG